MSLSDFISPTAFFFAFFFGILLVYLLAPLPDIIYRYPTPENAGKIVYQDHANTCYTYDVKPIDCPKDNVIETPLQETNNSRKNHETPLQRIQEKIRKA